MKRVAAALVVLIVLAFAAEAQAGWYMRYGQAKSESKHYARELCADLPECEAWGVGRCERRTSARFDCLIGTWYPGVEYLEEIECQQWLYWGVRRGYVTLVGKGPPRCS